MIIRNLFQYLKSTFRRQEIPTLSVVELHHKLQQYEALLLLDVRSSDEYSSDGHIPGSRLLPLSMLRMRLDELPQEGLIVCVCRSGRRSHVACELLIGHGFNNTRNLNGGMLAWRQSGFPINSTMLE